MVTRNSRDVIYWTTKCSTYVFKFPEDKTYYDGCNGPDVLIAEGPGISDPYFVNIAKIDIESVNKRSVYVGFIYGELVEITIKPISGKISFKIYKKRAARFIKALKEKGYFGGIA